MRERSRLKLVSYLKVTIPCFNNLYFLYRHFPDISLFRLIMSAEQYLAALRLTK